MTRSALLSVYNKEGIEDFARRLVALGFKLYSSGGTAGKLEEANIEVTDVASLVGGAAILGHKVVTLSREVHAGLLADYDGPDLLEMEKLGLPYIDLVCVDLYPLQAEIAKPDSTSASVIAQTDIGGPTMLRSAAKGGRIVIGSAPDRAKVLEWLENGEANSEQFRNDLAAKAEFVVADYALASSKYRGQGKYEGFIGHRVSELRYGENAWQTPAGLYSIGSDDPLAFDRFKVEAGSLGRTNYTDIDRMLQTMTHIVAGFEVNDMTAPCIAIGVKHGNACGVGISDGPFEAIEKMLQGHKVSIFGGSVMVNFPIGKNEAAALRYRVLKDKESARILDLVAAPAFTEDAIDGLHRKGDRCKMVSNPALESLNRDSLDGATQYRQVRGGFITQPNYTYVLNVAADTVSYFDAVASPEQKRDMVLAWAIGSTSNSNTITLVRDGQLLGNGVGQQDRVGAADLAIKKARDAAALLGLRKGDRLEGAVAYSDSFFPFPDAVEVLIKARIKVILTSSGSLRDELTQEACHKAGVALYMVPDVRGRGFFGH